MKKFLAFLRRFPIFIVFSSYLLSSRFNYYDKSCLISINCSSSREWLLVVCFCWVILHSIKIKMTKSGWKIIQNTIFLLKGFNELLLGLKSIKIRMSWQKRVGKDTFIPLKDMCGWNNLMQWVLNDWWLNLPRRISMMFIPRRTLMQLWYKKQFIGFKWNTLWCLAAY